MTSRNRPSILHRTAGNGALFPALFVVLWSTGFIAGKFSLSGAGPFSFLAVRFSIVAAVFLGVSVATRAPWPGWRRVGRLALSGILLQAGYLNCTFAAMANGVEPGIAALVLGLQPLLTAGLAGWLLGERVTWKQWLGLILGLAGVALVVEDKLSLGHTSVPGLVFALLAALSLTAGTLWQKRVGGAMDLRTGSFIQFFASALVTAPIAAVVEGFRITWSVQVIGALAWLCLVLSFGALPLLFVLIRRGEASRVGSLFFLVPPVTALFGYVCFGDTLNEGVFAGMVLVCASIALVNARR
ncbi:MAG TPA: DMT family transporter [Acidiphilium sp.]